jgi:hypothetical protein
MAHLRRRHNVDTGILFFAQRNNIGVFPLDQEDPTVKTQSSIDKFPGMHGIPAMLHPTLRVKNKISNKKSYLKFRSGEKMKLEPK